ncbi:MAG: hypothetical protein AAFZ18_11465 [Myxococcota bacterium]
MSAAIVALFGLLATAAVAFLWFRARREAEALAADLAREQVKARMERQRHAASHATETLHSETIAGLRAELELAKSEAEKVPGLEEQRDLAERSLRETRHEVSLARRDVDDAHRAHAELESCLALLGVHPVERDVSDDQAQAVLEALVARGHSAAVLATGEGLVAFGAGRAEVGDRIAAAAPWLSASRVEAERTLDDALLMVSIDRRVSILTAVPVGRRWLIVDASAADDLGIRLAALQLGVRAPARPRGNTETLALLRGTAEPSILEEVSRWTQSHTVDQVAVVGGSDELSTRGAFPEVWRRWSSQLKEPLNRLARDGHDLTTVSVRLGGWSGQGLTAQPLTAHAVEPLLVVDAPRSVSSSSLDGLGERLRWHQRSPSSESHHAV